MALSFSRPDPASPSAVGAASFPVARRGYDQTEVRDFLRMVAAELARLQEREQFLQSEVRALQTRGMSAPGRLDEETVATLLGEEAARVLTVARDASQQIRERAEEAATRLVKEAAQDAARIREAAHLEAARIREDTAHDADAAVEESKRQGRDMVVEAREYREKVLAELVRRREAARGQIEELIHGRERLLAAFERAQLAAQSVIGELSDAHDEPEFIVDLSPVTGPVPVVNPDHPSLPTRTEVRREVPMEEEVEERFPDVPAPSDLSTMITEEEAVIHETVDAVDGHVTVVDAPEFSLVGPEEDDDVVVDHDDATIVVDSPAEDPAVDDTLVVEPSDDDVEPTRDESVDDDASSNIVSIFDRSRRHLTPPETVPQIAPDDETAPPAEPEPPAPEVLPRIVAVTADKLPPAHGHRPSADETNDLFSRLRGASTAEVARRSATRTGPGHPVHDATAKESPAPTKKRAASVAAAGDPDPAKVLHPAAPTPAPVDGATFALRERTVEEVAASTARKVRRILVDEQNEVLQHLQQKKSSTALDAMLGASGAHVERFVRGIADDSAVAAGAGARAVKDFGSQARRVRPDKVSTEVGETVEACFVGPVRAAMSATIGAAADDRQALVAAVRDLYRTWKGEAVEAVARDAAVRAFGVGLVHSLEAGTAVAWFVHPLDRCCSDCEDNSLGGPVVAGHAFAAGTVQVPAHPGCRCLVWPVRN